MINSSSLHLTRKTGFTEKKPGSIKEIELKEWKQEAVYGHLESWGLRKLFIFRSFGAPIVYKGGFLQGILEKRPPLSELTEMWSVEIPGEGSRQVPKAKLVQCGSHIDQMMQDVGNRILQLSEKCASLRSLDKIIGLIETRPFDAKAPRKREAAFRQFLGFTPLPPYIPLSIGRNEWERHFGSMTKIQNMPQEVLLRMLGPCPLTKVKDLETSPLMGDTHVFFWRPAKWLDESFTVKSFREICVQNASKNRYLGYKYAGPGILEDVTINKPLKRGYWVAMYKKPLALKLSLVQQQKFVDEQCPGYAFPKTLEAVIGSMMHHACTKGLRRAEVLQLHYTRCEESIEMQSVLVGFLNLTSRVDIRTDRDVIPKQIGVCPVIRLTS